MRIVCRTALPAFITLLAAGCARSRTDQVPVSTHPQMAFIIDNANDESRILLGNGLTNGRCDLSGARTIGVVRGHATQTLEVDLIKFNSRPYCLCAVLVNPPAGMGQQSFGCSRGGPSQPPEPDDSVHVTIPTNFVGFVSP